jgi:RNA polymerase sigma factor (TIGR02999 family)
VTSFDTDSALARDQLFASLYHELHRMAHRALSHERGQLSISTTTLLHEAYLKLPDGGRFPDRRQFLTYAAQAMRGLVIDAARRKQAIKRGAGFEITRLDLKHADAVPDEQQLSRIDEALEALAQIDPSLVELVDLKFFCGLTLTEIGALRGVTERHMQREWRKARLLLLRFLTENDVQP